MDFFIAKNSDKILNGHLQKKPNQICSGRGSIWNGKDKEFMILNQEEKRALSKGLLKKP